MPVTMRDIARASGFSKTAVWMALSNNHRIPESTRKTIRKVARSLGYKPNAAYAQMLRQVRAGQPVSYKSTLALLHGFDIPEPDKKFTYHAKIVKGAYHRAEELGYGIDSFWINEPGMSGRRLEGILRARSIMGTLVTPMPVHRPIDLDWTRFAAATIGYTLLGPRINRVHVNNQQASAICLRQLMELGYGRIGLVQRADHENSRQYELSAPYHWQQAHLPPRSRTPVIVVDPQDPKSFLAWFKKYQFDALITTHPCVIAWLKKEGMKIPGDVGIVFPTPVPDFPKFSRVLHYPERLGSAAVDMLVAQINRGETGPPANPKSIHTDVGWHQGTSIRRVGPPRDAAPLHDIVSLPELDSHEVVLEGGDVPLEATVH